MLFNSYIFILCFLPITFFTYFILNRFKMTKSATLSLLIASLIFYAYFNINYLPIILTSIFGNYILNKIIRNIKNKKVKKLVLFLGLIFNVGIIFYFKYFDFFITNINVALKTNFNLLKLILPLGISFFTFQQISYIIDVYKGEVEDYKFIDYALFVTFFPQLIAGPIVLHSEIIPQFQNKNNKKIDYSNVLKGLYAFSLGLFKKVIIADTFGIVVNRVFDVLGPNTNTTNLIIGMISYTIQIYFDFSGYCDMATGIALLFNIKLPINFNSPYKSYNINEFWDRWHMTLTRFLTTYVYIPLGGNRKGKIRTYINIMIVFLVSGIWHGANFTFILWGLLHGLASVIVRIFKKTFDKINPVFLWIMNFIFINITWIFFRASSVTNAISMIKNMLSCNFGPIDSKIFIAFQLPELKQIVDIMRFRNPNICIYMLLFFAFAVIAILCMQNTNEKLENFNPNYKKVFTIVVLTVWGIVSLSGVSTFLYFNF